MSARGFFGIGIYHGKHQENQGTLWRSAFAFGASFVFTVGPRFIQQASDTPKTHRHLPTYCYRDIDDLIEHLPYGCQLIGVELDTDASSLTSIAHPCKACYLLGAEDYGLPVDVMKRCHRLIKIDGLKMCLNVSTTGSLVLYDRIIKEKKVQ